VAVFLRCGQGRLSSDSKQLFLIDTTPFNAGAGRAHHVKELLREFRTANIDCIQFQKKQNLPENLLPPNAQVIHGYTGVTHMSKRAYSQFKKIQHPFLNKIHTIGA